MKKFIFILVAALAAVSLNAAGNAMADRLANATPTPMTNFQKATPELYQKFLNRHKAAPRKVEQTTLYKGYAWESAECTSRSETYDISAGTAINLPVIISAGPGTDSVLITGMEPYFPLQGKFYADYDQIEIPNGQVVYTHSTYGDCGLNSSFYFEGDEEDEAGWYTYGAAWGEVLDDGSISFEDQYLSMSILSGTYAGYRLGNFIYGGTLTPDNTVGRMEIVDLNADNFSSPDVPTSTIPVTLNQEGAVVTVGNFGKWGTVDVNLLADRTLAIPSQLIYEGGSTYGDFYTRAWYMVVDNPGPAKSLSWRVFDVCGPAEHHNNVEKNPSFTIRRETDVRRVDTPWMEVNFHTNRPISVIRIRPSRKPGEEFDLYGEVV